MESRYRSCDSYEKLEDQRRTKGLSLVDVLEWELGNYVLKVDKLMQPTSILLLFRVGLSGYELI